MNPVGAINAAHALVIDPDVPRLEDVRASWSIVVVDRCPGPMGPVTVGYLGRHVAQAADGGSALVIADPFDYQAGWIVDQKRGAMTRGIDIMPCEGFTLESIRIDRHLAIIACCELTDKACELVYDRLSRAVQMRSHFRKVGSIIAQS